MILALPLFACRMLGVIALPGESLSATNSEGEWHPYLMDELEEFRRQGGSGGWPYNNRDGWAMTSYSMDGGLPLYQTIRSDIEAYSDAEYYYHTSVLLAAPEVPILLGHLRQTSSGAGDIENPHPFIFQSESGEIYSFAHNGDVGKEELRTLIGDEWLNLHPPQTYGGGPWNGSGWDDVVDSELFFFWIVKNIEETGGIYEGIQQAMIILEEQQPFMLKNFLFSDGHDLYGYRRSSMSDIHYFDASDEANFPQYLSESNHSAIMSTPPTDGAASELPWIELPDRALVVLTANGSTEIYEDFLLTGLEAPVQIPEQSELSPAYPNPFNNATVIPLRVDGSGDYKLEVYDALGHQVYSKSIEIAGRSEYEFYWSGTDLQGKDLNSGSYIYRVSQDSDIIGTGKLLLLK